MYGKILSYGLQAFEHHMEHGQQQQPPEQEQASATSIATPDGDVIKSNCLGAKKALFIGINYTGTKVELKGCINDVHRIKKFLFEHYGFSEANSRTLTDDSPNPSLKPTYQNIMNSFRWLVDRAQPGDSLFLHYSGHGGSVPDTNGDEADGFDETIIPLDYLTAGQIVDDNIHDTLVKNLPEGVRLTAVFDSCHSGSVLDLPYTYTATGSDDQPISETHNHIAAAGKAIQAIKAFAHHDKAAAFQLLRDGVALFLTPASPAEPQSDAGGEALTGQKSKTTIADVIQFSGCRDDQTSADAVIEGAATGAMSYALISILSQPENKNITYVELLKKLRTTLIAGKYSQVPQLSTGHKMDLNTQFLL